MNHNEEKVLQGNDSHTFTPNGFYSEVYVLLSTNNQLIEKLEILLRRGSAAYEPGSRGPNRDQLFHSEDIFDQIDPLALDPTELKD